MSGTVIIVLWAVWSIALWVVYHKIFTVYYMSVSQGLMKEFLTAMLLGALMTGVTLYLWWLAAIIIIIAGITFSNKVDNKAPLVIAIVLAVIVALVGINFRKDVDSEQNANESAMIVEEMDVMIS